MNLTTASIQRILQIPQPAKNPDRLWTHICTDSRQPIQGALFVALVGENFDGHKFVKAAIEGGCVGLLVQESQALDLSEAEMEAVEIFKVPETLKALQMLAMYQAHHLETCLKVAITGTSGKTTTKYFAHQILQKHVEHYFSPKSFNNHIGVPLSIMDIQPQDKIALLEVGTNHPGEISQLMEIIEPDVSLVTMAGRGHLEGFGSQDAVLKEKMSIYLQGKSHIINSDDEKIKNFYKKYLSNEEVTQLWVSQKDPHADVYLQVVAEGFADFKVVGHINGQHGEALIPISGSHHVANVLMAVGIALHSSMSIAEIWQALSQLQPFWGRSQVIQAEGLNFYFDAYNANPESMQAFLQQIKKTPQSPYIILGEMLELGEHAPALHHDLGVLAAQVPHQKLWFMGPSAEFFKQGYLSLGGEKNLIISDTYKESLALDYKSMLKTGDWIALKGSRGMRLEQFLSLFEGVKLH